MRSAALFGLSALLPAALGTVPSQASGLAMTLCSGNGAARVISIPLGRAGLPGSEAPACCEKGCQTGRARRRAKRGA